MQIWDLGMTFVWALDFVSRALLRGTLAGEFAGAHTPAGAGWALKAMKCLA